MGEDEIEASLPELPSLESNFMKIVPLGDKLVVKRLAAEDQTSGGIFLPDAARERPQQGKVLSVGEGRLLPNGERRALQVGEGDRVLFDHYAGIPVTVDEEELLVMNEADILAVMEIGRS
jgi:chaperonin GroES